MPRTDTNRAAEMEAFVQVVERGGFSAAARALGMTPSAISKLMARLEARLGAQLLLRSTRKLQATPEGQDFYERSVRVLADMDEAERMAGSSGLPRGRISVNASLSFGHRMLIPLVPRFRAQCPEVKLDIALTDRVIDLMDERTDVAIRWGRLPASDLVARRLGETRQMIVASPDYLARHGVPRSPEALAQHARLGWSTRRTVPDWPLRVQGRQVDVAIEGALRASDGETLRRLALEGLGLARLSRYHIQCDLDAGTLVPVLEDCNPGDCEPIHAVYLGKTGRLPARIRAFLDFLAAEVDQATLDRGRPRG